MDSNYLAVLTKTYIFFEKFDFSPKTSIFEQNSDFWRKLRFLTKTSIFEENLDF